MIDSYAHLTIYLWWVIVSGDKQEVTSQCNPASTASGRRQHRQLRVGLFHSLWRYIETNLADIDSSRPATTLVNRVFTEKTRPGCWCSSAPFLPLSLRHSPFPSRLPFALYALRLCGRCVKIDQAEIVVKSFSDFGSISFQSRKIVWKSLICVFFSVLIIIKIYD